MLEEGIGYPYRNTVQRAGSHYSYIFEWDSNATSLADKMKIITRALIITMFIFIPS